MKEKVEQFIASRDTLKKELIKFCKDESVPLQERWEIFVKADLGDMSRWTTNCKPINDIMEVDEMEFEKYSSQTYADIIGDWEDDDKRKIEVQKYALSEFEKGFTHDW